MLIFGYRLQLQQVHQGWLSPVCSNSATTVWHRYRVYHLLLGYHNYYTTQGSPYTSAHVQIENTLIQHKMPKNSHMVLCCQNRVCKGTNQRYGLHSHASISVHSASVTEVDLLKKKKKKKKKKQNKKESVQNGIISRFQDSYLNHTIGSYKWLRQKWECSRMLPIYLFLHTTHLQRSLSRFTHNTLIEVAILNLGHSYIPTYQRGW